MDATKENCREAFRRIVEEGNKPGTTMTDANYSFLVPFFVALEKRLPSAAAVKADRKRRKAKKSS